MVDIGPPNSHIITTMPEQSLIARKVPTLMEVAELAKACSELPQTQCGLVSRFTPGMYIRELTVPKDTFVVTAVHKTEHPFVISKGKIAVWTEAEGVVVLQAPYCGITKPGTVRMAVTMEDTVWTTFHVTNETDVEKLELELGTDPRRILIGD